jgi:transcriptional regulator with XRE-family HTH domain
MTENCKTYGAFLPILGEQIRLWRLARKVTQADLEQKAGLSHNAVSRIECGSVSPRIDTLERVAQALDVSVEQLQFQQPALKCAEPQTGYEMDAHVAELIEALKKLPDAKRTHLIRTFMELVRMATGETDV